MSSIVVSGDTSGAVTLSAPAVAGTVTVTLPAASGTMAVLPTATGVLAESAGGTGTTTGYYGFKNRIINGAMVIDQRNAGASITPSADTYTLDRWIYFGSQASKFTIQQNKSSVTPPTGFANYLGMSVASAVTIGAGDYFSIAQYIEGFNIADLGWGTANAKTVTLSFQVYSSLTGTFGASIRNSGNSRSYPFTYTISSANTWTSISVTIAGDTSGTWLTTNATGISINFGLGIGSTYSGTAGAWASANYASATGGVSVVGTNGATFYITGVQLEKGSTATSFDYRPYGTELALCQRYYYKQSSSYYQVGFLDGGTGEYPMTWVTHPVAMRSTPTVVFENLGAFYYNNNTVSTSFTPSGGTTAYFGSTTSGGAIKNLISNGPGASTSQRTGQWLLQLSFSSEL
jgi:hypothetical protein